ncbi:TPA: LysE family transporter [Pseudomonas aeruginosa]|uniref:LysE family transporter n=1 Tax=Pseudomonas aeruginosa TaxID=287 RepID=UPI00053DF011|nr:LysE family transporter [Pseudomonas aeruginosa]MBH9066987.1 LysE family transporter [Pseudomonas aeruginosa]
MQELSVLLTLAAVFAIALVSPGPDVALVVRTTLHQGRRAGLASALGLACGILLHTTLVLTGVSLLLSLTLTRPALQARLLRAVPWLDAACGVVFLLVAAAILEHLVRSA